MKEETKDSPKQGVNLYLGLADHYVSLTDNSDEVNKQASQEISKLIEEGSKTFPQTTNTQEYRDTAVSWLIREMSQIVVSNEGVRNLVSAMGIATIMLGMMNELGRLGQVTPTESNQEEKDAQKEKDSNGNK